MVHTPVVEALAKRMPEVNGRGYFAHEETNARNYAVGRDPVKRPRRLYGGSKIF